MQIVTKQNVILMMSVQFKIYFDSFITSQVSRVRQGNVAELRLKMCLQIIATLGRGEGHKNLSKFVKCVFFINFTNQF